MGERDSSSSLRDRLELQLKSCRRPTREGFGRHLGRASCASEAHPSPLPEHLLSRVHSHIPRHDVCPDFVRRPARAGPGRHRDAGVCASKLRGSSPHTTEASRDACDRGMHVTSAVATDRLLPRRTKLAHVLGGSIPTTFRSIGSRRSMDVMDEALMAPSSQMGVDGQRSARKAGASGS